MAIPSSGTLWLWNAAQADVCRSIAHAVYGSFIPFPVTLENAGVAAGFSTPISHSCFYGYPPIILDGLEYREVTSETGCVWLDRNLGATRVALLSSDSQSYGSLYQWGRGPDGHQLRTSSVTTSTSSSNTPGHNCFIAVNTFPYDWRNPQNSGLWNGVGGINLHAPPGFRLPNRAEWEDEVSTWCSEDAAGAFASPLKLPLAGERFDQTGLIQGGNVCGVYWTQQTISNGSAALFFTCSLANPTASTFRATGASVRLIKD